LQQSGYLPTDLPKADVPPDNNTGGVV